MAIVDNQKTKGNSYLGNINIKKDGVEIAFTQEQVDEYVKCSNDPVYFCTTYLKVIHIDHGLVPFKLYPYQEDLFRHFHSNRFSILLACRQSGKSISSCGYLLWFAIFHADKDIAIVANKGSTAREMLNRITLMLEYLPFWLQPGCKALNKGNIDFSNNSRLIASATSGSSIRGLSIALLFLDEFAFVEDAERFYTSTYPVISGGKKSQVIIASTQNGPYTQFNQLLTNAEAGANDFAPFRVDWWDVPGRDEEWKRQTIANTSELQFRQEYGNECIGASNTLISAKALLGLTSGAVIKEDRNVLYYAKPQPDHDYIMTVDVSKGRGRDYSTFNVIDVTDGMFIQTAVFRDNLISPLLFPDIIVRTARMFNEAMVVIENNDAGQVVCNTVYYEYEYENTFVESMVKAGGIGVTMSKKVKRIGCSNLKDLIEMGKLKIQDKQTVLELCSFEAKGVGYEATAGANDDLVMNLVLFAWFVSSDTFGDLTDVNLRDLLYAERMQEIEADVPLFGIVDDGRDYNDAAAQQVQEQSDWSKAFG